MAMSKYEKKLRRKYRPAVNWAVNLGLIRQGRYDTKDELFLETMNLICEKIADHCDNVADDFPSVIFSPVYNAFYECEQEMMDLCEFLEERVYND